MKKLFLFICMTGLLFMAVPHHAEAQFLKNLFQKDKKKKPVRTPPAETGKQSKTDKKDRDIHYPNSVRKDRYRVDILLPLYMDELVRDNKTTFRDKIPPKALAGISFYEGVKLAADTMDAKQYQVDVYIHDISSEHARVEQLLSRKILDSSDLLIGMVQSAQVTPLARFAKKKQINFISVLSPSDGGVQQNPYFTLLQPTLHTHCDLISEAARKKFPGRPIVFYHHSAIPADETAFGFVSANREPRDIIIPCNSMPDLKALRNAFDSLETNVVIIPVLDIRYADSLLMQLDEWFPGYHFEIFGMPSWNALHSVKKTGTYTNMAFSFTTPYYFDPTTSAGQVLSERYNRVFGGAPGEWVFRGYETFLWYAGLLRKWGTIFNPGISDNSGAVFTKYKIRPARDEKGEFLYNENRHLYLYRYQGGSYMAE